MNATAVERITPLQSEPTGGARRILPPSIRSLVRWGLIAAVAIGAILSVVPGLVQKWLWMRQLDYEGILDVYKRQVSTEMPMSAARSAGESLMPSPRNPTT